MREIPAKNKFTPKNTRILKTNLLKLSFPNAIYIKITIDINFAIKTSKSIVIDLLSKIIITEEIPPNREDSKQRFDVKTV